MMAFICHSERFLARPVLCTSWAINCSPGAFWGLKTVVLGSSLTGLGSMGASTVAAADGRTIVLASMSVASTIFRDLYFVIQGQEECGMWFEKADTCLIIITDETLSVQVARICRDRCFAEAHPARSRIVTLHESRPL